MSELNLNPDTDIGVEGIEHNHHEHDAQLITAPVTQSATATASGDCNPNHSNLKLSNPLSNPFTHACSRFEVNHVSEKTIAGHSRGISPL